MKIISGIENDEPFPFPIVSDTNRILTLYLNVLDAKCIDKNGIPVPCRGTIVLTPDMHIQLIQLYPQEVGRNFGLVYHIPNKLIFLLSVGIIKTK